MAKTALELSPEELCRYNPAKRLDTQSADEHWQNAWELVPKLVAILKQQFAAEQVAVFGSLTNKKRYTPWSDIDLAVWGLTPNQLYQAIEALNETSSDFKIDLVDPTNRTCRPSVKQAIEQTGVIV